MQTVLEPSRSLSVFRQIGSHEIERRSRQGSVQSSERPLEGSQSRGGTIQRAESRGWLWRRTGKRVSSESRVQNSTCLPVGLERGGKWGESRVQSSDWLSWTGEEKKGLGEFTFRLSRKGSQRVNESRVQRGLSSVVKQDCPSLFREATVTHHDRILRAGS